MGLKFSLLQMYLIGALGLLLIACFWSYRTFSNIETQNQKILHEVMPVSLAASRLYPLMLEQEISVRSFLVYEKKEDLEQYRMANYQLHDNVNVIKKLGVEHQLMQEIVYEEALPLIEESERFQERQLYDFQSGQQEKSFERRLDGVKILGEFKEVDQRIHDHIQKIIDNAGNRSEDAKILAVRMRNVVITIVVLLILAFLHTIQVEKNRRKWMYQSEHDGLTGLKNRRVFDRELKELLQIARLKRQKISLILLDVDHFKKYNDKYGHVAGDRCLKEIAKVLRLIGDKYGIVTRYGGEEFAIILKENIIHSLDIAEQIRMHVYALAIEHQKNPPFYNVSVSLGIVTLIPDETETPASVIEYADQALYQSKIYGRNQVSIFNFKDKNKKEIVGTKAPI
ncbi:sensor domain-containing diguanylate cyclase [Exiguobacterium artemiae]